MSDIKVLALDLDGTLTNDQKLVTPRTRAALDAAIEKGVTIVLASGRPTAGIQPLAEELGLDKKGGCILSYNGGKIVDCRTGETLVEKTLDPALVPELCAFAAAQDIAILTYNREGIVCERDKDEWANKECFTTKLPMIHVDDLASYVNYPVCKMLITLDPARRDAVCAAGQQQSVAVQAAVQVPAQHHPGSGSLQRRRIIAVLARHAVQENSRLHRISPLHALHARGEEIMPTSSAAPE